MSDYSEDDSAREKIRERAAQNEPVVDTVILDILAETDLPLRGEFRQEAVERLREQVRKRRTVEGVSQRIANNLTSPVTDAIDRTIERQAKEKVQERLESTVKQQGEE